MKWFGFLLLKPADQTTEGNFLPSENYKTEMEEQEKKDNNGEFEDDGDLIDRDDQQRFLASADFLSTYALPALISNMQAAVTEVLKGKQLRDFINTTVLHETIIQILNTFMSIRSPHLWVGYLMPEDARLHELATASSSDDKGLSDVTKFDQLMVETRAVISSKPVVYLLVYFVSKEYSNVSLSFDFLSNPSSPSLTFFLLSTCLSLITSVVRLEESSDLHANPLLDLVSWRPWLYELSRLLHIGLVMPESRNLTSQLQQPQPCNFTRSSPSRLSCLVDACVIFSASVVSSGLRINGSFAKFVNVAEIALKAVVNTLVKEIGIQCGGDTLANGMPLARLLARVTHVGPILLVEPSKNQFIQTIRNEKEVEMLITLIYTDANVMD
ncbi:Peroxisome biogenesis protein 3-2 [Morus notabilis]|uniref:Peroxisome biogenesis protein 3-2 n=1 Tax=Morus notabilis TaxID=981085 RepID=W9RD60_9ROSA|nr:Peroxisome biogenesis protein 3-2 [Morus notabilis]